MTGRRVLEHLVLIAIVGSAVAVARLTAPATSTAATNGATAGVGAPRQADEPSAPTGSDEPTVRVPTTAPLDGELLSTTSDADLPDGCDGPGRHLSLYAVQLPDAPDGSIRLGYGATPETASFPGPTIEMIEGECLAITLTNRVPAETLAALRDHPTLGIIEQDPANPLPLGVSLHVHGVKYTPTSDGTMHTGSWVPPGQARTYVWYAEPREVDGDGHVVSHGSAGAWWYHDHVAGTDHGTGGIGSGLFGALVVRRPGDPLPDRTFALAMGNDASINLRRYPGTDTCDPQRPVPSPTCLVAYEGERVEFVVFGVGDDFHTFHLHGHTWVDNRHGVLTPTDDQERLIDVVGLGPSESFGFSIVAGHRVGRGDWMIHCHVQRHSDLGMFTFLHVVPRDGDVVLSEAGSIDTTAPGVDADAAAVSGARFRGSADPVPETPASPPSLAFYCSLPLSQWAQERSAA